MNDSEAILQTTMLIAALTIFVFGGSITFLALKVLQLYLLWSYAHYNHASPSSRSRYTQYYYLDRILGPSLYLSISTVLYYYLYLD